MHLRHCVQLSLVGARVSQNTRTRTQIVSVREKEKVDGDSKPATGGYVKLFNYGITICRRGLFKLVVVCLDDDVLWLAVARFERYDLVRSEIFVAQTPTHQQL